MKDKTKYKHYFVQNIYSYKFLNTFLTQIKNNVVSIKSVSKNQLHTGKYSKMVFDLQKTFISYVCRLNS